MTEIGEGYRAIAITRAPGERWDQQYTHAVADTSYAPCGARRRKAAFAGQRADLRSVLGSHFHGVTGNARRQA